MSVQRSQPGRCVGFGFLDSDGFAGGLSILELVHFEYVELFELLHEQAVNETEEDADIVVLRVGDDDVTVLVQEITLKVIGMRAVETYTGSIT